MNLEISIGTHFLISYLYNKLPRRSIDLLYENLMKNLTARYKNHWYPKTPLKGTAYRCIKLPIDPIIKLSALESNIILSELVILLPDLNLWIDPGEVCYNLADDENNIVVIWNNKVNNIEKILTTGSGLGLGQLGQLGGVGLSLTGKDNNVTTIGGGGVNDENDLANVVGSAHFGGGGKFIESNNNNPLMNNNNLNNMSNSLSTHLNNQLQHQQHHHHHNKLDMLDHFMLTSSEQQQQQQQQLLNNHHHHQQQQQQVHHQLLQQQQPIVVKQPLLPQLGLQLQQQQNGVGGIVGVKSPVVTSSGVVTPLSSSSNLMTTAAFAQTKFGSTKLKINNNKKLLRQQMSPIEFSNYIKSKQQQQLIGKLENIWGGARIMEQTPIHCNL